MGILNRYLIRAHAGPFLFALTAITGLLFLNAVAQRLEDLTGKGLGWRTIVEFMVLSLPHTVALSLPMATLVAVLYAFSELTAHNEFTAMKAGGVRPQRLLLPLLGVAFILTEVMFVSNDQLLPEANHRLKNLLLDVGRKSPTFELREQVVNEVAAADGRNPVFLTASRIDNASNELDDVVVYDAGPRGSHRTTFAKHGTMAFNAARTDLFLTLWDGVVLETDPERTGAFRQLSFSKQVVQLRGVGNELERRMGASDRGDREMSTGMLQDRVDGRREELADLSRRLRLQTRQTVLEALGRVPPERGPGTVAPRLSLPGRFTADALTERAALNARGSVSQAEILERSINQARVEIHKKYALSFACVVFVLLGAPLAMRYPRGGLGLVIAASSGIFAVSWMGLIGGENLADRGIAPPWVAMWAPNLIFTVLGLFMVRRMGREAASIRGGGWDELAWSLRAGRRRAPRPETA